MSMQSANDFSEDRCNKGAIRANGNKKAEVVLAVDGSREGLAAEATAHANSALRRGSGASDSANQMRASTLKFITWNIQGLNETKIILRTEAVVKHIKNEQADIVFLQEVVPLTAEYILKNLSDYDCFFGNENGYFVGTLLKKSSVSYSDFDVIEFPHTRMMRNAVKVDATFQNLPLRLLNSHLESCDRGSEQRMQQLQIVFKEVISASEDHTVIFAGDLNLMDKELASLGGLPTGIEDLWVMCGSPEECAYTFDMTRNDNLVFDGRFKPRCRYDRVYMRRSSPSKLKAVYFGLIGLERLLPNRCFPSDHWGILCHFEME